MVLAVEKTARYYFSGCCGFSELADVHFTLGSMVVDKYAPGCDVV